MKPHAHEGKRVKKSRTLTLFVTRRPKKPRPKPALYDIPIAMA